MLNFSFFFGFIILWFFIVMGWGFLLKCIGWGFEIIVFFWWC